MAMLKYPLIRIFLISDLNTNIDENRLITGIL